MFSTLRHHLTSAASALFLLAAVAVPATAQESISEEHIAAARETVLAANAIRAFDNVLPLMADRTRTLFIQSNPANTSEIDAVVNEVADIVEDVRQLHQRENDARRQYDTRVPQRQPLVGAGLRADARGGAPAACTAGCRSSHAAHGGAQVPAVRPSAPAG